MIWLIDIDEQCVVMMLDNYFELMIEICFDYRSLYDSKFGFNLMSNDLI